MKKGMVLFKVGNLNLAESLRAYAEAGFDGVEVRMREERDDFTLSPWSSEEEVRRFGDEVSKAGLEVPSVMGGLQWQYPLTSPDPKVAERSKESIRLTLKVARLLGADTVLVVPGVVDEETPYDVAYERALGALRELAPEAEREGVYIGVENVWNKFLLSPLEMARFIDEVGSDYVRAYFDVGNVVLFGFPQHWIRILGGRISKVHLKDFGQSGGFTYLFQGDVNWPEVMRALKEVGYDGYLTAELSPYRHFPEKTLRDTAEAIGRLISSSFPS